MGFAGGAGHTANRHFCHAGAIQTGESRNETMQLSIKVDVLQDQGLVCFERCAEIVKLHTGSFGHKPIRNPGRELSPNGIHPMLPPTAGDILPLTSLGNLSTLRLADVSS